MLYSVPVWVGGPATHLKNPSSRLGQRTRRRYFSFALVSAAIFHEPSACFFQTSTNLPLCVIGVFARRLERSAIHREIARARYIHFHVGKGKLRRWPVGDGLEKFPDVLFSHHSRRARRKQQRIIHVVLYGFVKILRLRGLYEIRVTRPNRCFIGGSRVWRRCRRGRRMGAPDSQQGDKFCDY